MILLLIAACLLVILTLASYADRVYSEMGKFLAREFQENLDIWTENVEPRLRLSRESIAMSASVLRQMSLSALALLFGVKLAMHSSLLPILHNTPNWTDYAEAAFELILIIILFDRLLPYVFFTRTSGEWAGRIHLIWTVLFYLVLPVTLLLGLLLSIASLAEHQDEDEADHPSEGVDALLEAGEEEGILEESDRDLVRSVVEFGDKVVREIMTPRPDMFTVTDALTIAQFTTLLQQHAFSRVPVYSGVLDNITGIAFAHDLLQIPDTEADQRTVREIQRPAEFVPEPKKVNELLREMQREKQHMRIVIDEYGSVAGLVTIEDLIEAIVGEIADEHESTIGDDWQREDDGSYILDGSFEVARLRTLLRRELTSDDDGDTDDDFRLPTDFEATTIGGLVSEIAGHIPLPGEVVEEEGLRVEVLASTDRRVDRVRVSHTPTTDEEQDD